MSPETKVSTSASSSDWAVHSHQDKDLVKGLGLTSATTLVMGSMIGSGIFIVSAEIARETNSPALLIGAWLVTGFLTIVAALSYGELAAMMPRAGGQYVYLREAFGPMWGFLYGWTLFLVIQTGTIAAVGVAFGKFLGVFFPSISASNWIGPALGRFLLFIRLGTIIAGQYECRAEYPEPDGYPRGDCAFAGEYFRSEDWGDDPECFYDCEGCGVVWVCCCGTVCWTQCARARRLISGKFLA